MDDDTLIKNFFNQVFGEMKLVQVSHPGNVTMYVVLDPDTGLHRGSISQRRGPIYCAYPLFQDRDNTGIIVKNLDTAVALLLTTTQARFREVDLEWVYDRDSEITTSRLLKEPHGEE